jgi:hypothetical protein
MDTNLRKLSMYSVVHVEDKSFKFYRTSYGYTRQGKLCPLFVGTTERTRLAPRPPYFHVILDLV